MTPTVTRPNAGQEFETPERCHVLKIWNDADDPAVSIARARVAPGVTTRLHRLRGLAERCLVMSGSGVLKLAGLAPEAVGPRDVVVIPAGVARQITSNGAADLVFSCICRPAFTASSYEALEQRQRWPEGGR